MHGSAQSCGQVSWLSPHWGWHWALPQRQSEQSWKQVNGSSPHCGSQMKLPHVGAPQGLQSNGQVWRSSPHWGWQKKSPQMQFCPQSMGQLKGSSPHPGSQLPSPQNDSNPQKQSMPQLSWSSPHSGEQTPSPQKTLGGHAPQSCGQLPGFSPQAKSQRLSPQTQPSKQTRTNGSHERPPSEQSSQASPLAPQALLSDPTMHVPAVVQQPSGQVAALHGMLFPPLPPFPPLVSP
jgi:hypothetical protein